MIVATIFKTEQQQFSVNFFDVSEGITSHSTLHNKTTSTFIDALDIVRAVGMETKTNPAIIDLTYECQ